ncbi:hypothetical protein Tco_1189819 [Tanacetum coccineum]
MLMEITSLLQNGWKGSLLKGMMIELDRYSNQKEDVVFKFLLQSFSTYQYGDGWIYVEGVEFRAIEKGAVISLQQNEVLGSAKN